MKNSARIGSADRKQALEARGLDGDVLLALTNAGMQLRLRFSSLMRASFTRPWDYRPLDLAPVNCEVRDNTMLVEGGSAKFEVKARFEFKDNRLHCACWWTT